MNPRGADTLAATGRSQPYAAGDVTIAIVTRNRRDELARALRSALEQVGDPEVLVVDDGSTDGTAAMVRGEFPSVRLVRFEHPAGIAVRRNDVTDAVRGSLILSIDDDAIFTSPTTVLETVRDFDHPRIALVGIPLIDVYVSPEELQRSPEPARPWVAAVFRAGAFAVRRDVLQEVGGFGSWVYHQGEEWDLSLRLLGAGWLIRLGRAEGPVHHLASPHRSLRNRDVYGRRNELLISHRYFPSPWNVLYLVGYAARGLAHGFRVGRSANMLRGLAAGLIECLRLRRQPLARRSFRMERHLRRRGGLPLAEVERRLHLPPLDWPAVPRDRVGEESPFRAGRPSTGARRSAP